MGRPVHLEVFESIDPPEGPALLMPEDLEALRLQAYEEGYRAGWDDASVERANEGQARQAAFMQKLEQLAFGYFEARAHVLAGLRPLLEAMLDTLLPVAARSVMVPRIVDVLMPLAISAAETPVILRVAPGEAEGVRAGVEGLVLPPLEIREDPGLQPDQALIDRAPQDIRIDLGAVVRELARAIDDFYTPQPEEARHV